MRALEMPRISAIAAVLVVVAAGCRDYPPVESVQTGFRGTGSVQIYDPETLDESVRDNPMAQIAATVPEGPPGEYINVQYLGNLSQAEMLRTMGSITQWVALQQGCPYCHLVDQSGLNFGSDSLYTYRTAKWMIGMTRNINREWDSHVAATGVTCNTCHAGNPVPRNVWYLEDENQYLRHYLDREDLRVVSPTALDENNPSEANRVSIKQTEYTYGLMIHISESLGVNCTYCHLSSRWASWDDSTPQRLTALRGIRMTRDINMNWIVPLQSVLPDERKGPAGDTPKVSCATCHNGAYKPFFGQRVATAYEAFRGPAQFPETP